MSDLTDLLAQQAKLQTEIDAAKRVAAEGIRKQMTELGLTVADLEPPSAKRPVRFRDAEGHTWTGIGQRPRWLTKAILAGATIESFAVKP